MIKCITDKPTTIKKLKRHLKALLITLATICLIGFIVEMARVKPEIVAITLCLLIVLAGVVCLYSIIYQLFTE
ncbi:hypothetical protein [Proteus phage PM 116]|uniref:Uncharacterized protein n=1 Tax=Proteus phage PM 116 TaxID=1837877 RepID=A0A2D0VLS3_9CAUD|nr:hypothetical protein HOS11_gp10 [Proteus phage PM 116]ANU80092.1 hypothetical protein [Proteus phage PM 116]